jgi:hypothetical protein
LLTCILAWVPHRSTLGLFGHLAPTSPTFRFGGTNIEVTMLTEATADHRCAFE